jgi:hypothetical protein
VRAIKRDHFAGRAAAPGDPGVPEGNAVTSFPIGLFRVSTQRLSNCFAARASESVTRNSRATRTSAVAHRPTRKRGPLPRTCARRHRNRSPRSGSGASTRACSRRSAPRPVARRSPSAARPIRLHLPAGLRFEPDVARLFARNGRLGDIVPDDRHPAGRAAWGSGQITTVFQAPSVRSHPAGCRAARAAAPAACLRAGRPSSWTRPTRCITVIRTSG